jgi:hypothetical protein
MNPLSLCFRLMRLDLRGFDGIENFVSGNFGGSLYSSTNPALSCS